MVHFRAYHFLVATLCFVVSLGATSSAQPGFNKDNIVRVSLNPATGAVIGKLSRWENVLLIGPEFMGFETAPNQTAQAIATLKDGRQIPLSLEEFGFLFAGAGSDTDLEIFTSASLLFNNFRVFQNLSSRLTDAPKSSLRIYVLGADWCAFCRPRTGSLLRFVGNTDKQVKSNVEVIYLEYNGDNEEIQNAPPIQQFIEAGALQKGRLHFPSFVVQAGGNILSKSDADIELDKLIAKKIPNPNLLNKMPDARDILGISRLFMTSIFTDVGQFEIDLIKKYQLAGVLVYRREAKGQSSQDIKNLFTKIQNTSQTPLLIAVDQEGGSVQRIMTTDTCELPPAEVLGGKSEATIERFASIMARDLLRAGINMNFNPVLDLKNSMNKDITGWSRAVSDDPAEVSRVAAVINRVLLKNGILTVGKHLPGIGATKDTHNEAASLPGRFSDFENTTLLPFLELMKTPEGLPAMMLGHVQLPDYDTSTGLAFSKSTIDRLIRYDMGFKGLLINDAFHMKSSTAYYSEEQAPYYALLAGVAPIYVNSNYLRPSLNFILSRLKDPTVPTEEKEAAKAAIKTAMDRITVAKKAMLNITPQVDVSTGCSTADIQFLNSLKNDR